MQPLPMSFSSSPTTGRGRTRAVLGDRTARTPNFDRIAREGVLCEHAFAPAPSCTASRHALPTGQDPWRLGGAFHLGGSLAADVPTFPALLAGAGYETGYCRKGVAPSRHEHLGLDPLGPEHVSFEEFLEQRDTDRRFFFWYGAGEPHRPYRPGEGEAAGIDPKSLVVPPFLPDNAVVRGDLADYYHRVERMDALAGELMRRLERRGLLEQTLVVRTSDNGMPFPRAKATLYDSGTRVPLAICWGQRVRGDRRLADFISLTDLAPTVLEACGLPVPEEMAGRSLLPALLSAKDGWFDSSRDHVVTGLERHVHLHPSRAIRTRDHLYLRRFAPESWSGTRIARPGPAFDFGETPWPTSGEAFSHNIDPGPSKQWMRQNSSKADRQAFGPWPAEELFDLREDPEQRSNLLDAADPDSELFETRRLLSDRLTRRLRTGGDPRFAQPGRATLARIFHQKNRVVVKSHHTTRQKWT